MLRNTLRMRSPYFLLGNTGILAITKATTWSITKIVIGKGLSTGLMPQDNLQQHLTLQLRVFFRKLLKDNYGVCGIHKGSHQVLWDGGLHGLLLFLIIMILDQLRLIGLFHQIISWRAMHTYSRILVYHQFSTTISTTGAIPLTTKS